MKTKRAVLFITFCILLFTVTAQNQITVNTVVKGKTVLEISKDHAVDAYNETTSIFSEGMSEATFVNECLKFIPNQYSELKDIYRPYATFLFSLHKNKLSELQIRNLTTGRDFVDCVNNLTLWNEEHPGENLDNIPGWLKRLIDFIKSGGTIWD